jgi:hypothetical protein
LTVAYNEDSPLAERLEREGSKMTLPQPSLPFRQRCWLAFQRALDPLGPPRPLRTWRRNPR